MPLCTPPLWLPQGLGGDIRRGWQSAGGYLSRRVLRVFNAKLLVGPFGPGHFNAPLGECC